MKKYNVHVYILYLLQFSDGKVVFEKERLDTIKKIVNCAINNYRSTMISREAEFDTYELKSDLLKEWIKLNASKDEEKDWISSQLITLVNAEIGYYHHRFISHFLLEVSCTDINAEIRRFRSSLQKYSNFLVAECKDSINSDQLHDNNNVHVNINGFYDYQLIIVEDSSDIHKKLEIPYSFQTTSLCFDIVKPGYIASIFEKKLLVRISIPCTIVYGHIQVSKDKILVRDLINAIYQHALYGRKIRLSAMEDVKMKQLTDPYKLDEQDLQNLWAYMIDTMGGKTSNLYAFKIFQYTLVVAIVAFCFTFVFSACDRLAGKETKERTTNANDINDTSPSKSSPAIPSAVAQTAASSAAIANPCAKETPRVAPSPLKH